LTCAARWNSKKDHFPGAINAPIRKLIVNSAQLPADKACEIVDACMHGEHAWIVKKIMGLQGYSNIVFLDGWIQSLIGDSLSLEK
jgi:hypothetical protein